MAPSFSRLPLYNELIDMCLDLVDSRAALMRARRVCHAMQEAVNRRFCVEKMLSGFVADVLELRRIQARIGAVFSGSQVMNFFDGRSYADLSDLDIYVFPGTAAAVGDHLITHENYQYLGVSWANDVASEPTDHGFSIYNSTHIRRVYSFAKGTRRIDLVACTASPVQAILGFHSTPVVNGITWDRAFSCFAAATWERREGMVLRRWNTAVDKYRARGFKIYDARISLSHQFSDLLRTGHRWVGDRDTWVMRLDTSGITPPTSTITLEHNSFTVTGVPVVSAPGMLKSTEYRIDTVSFEHALLPRSYAVAPLIWRFAENVMSCTRAQWLRSGLPFRPRVSLGSDNTNFEQIHTWDRFFFLACTAWRCCVPFNVSLDGVMATFFPLGGTVLSRPLF